MSFQLLSAQIIAGIAAGSLYFLVASGLTLIWGALGVINLAHGSFYMIAAFSATSIVYYFGPDVGLLVSLLVIPAGVVLFAVAAEVILFRRVYRSGIWGQLLLTFGLVLVFSDIVRTVFGPLPRAISAPQLLHGYIDFWGVRVATYQVAILLVTALVAIFLWYLLSRSRTGRLIRAAVDDPSMLNAVGVDVKKLRTRVMAIAAFLAAVAGVIAAPRGAVNGTLDVQIVIIAFAVIVMGGLGSVWGALIAGLVAGIAEAVSTLFVDQGSEVVIFVLMVLVLFVKPTGFRTIAGRD